MKHDTTRHNTIQQKSPLDSFNILYRSPHIYPDIKDIQHIDIIQSPTEAQQKPRNIKAPIYTPTKAIKKAPTGQGVKPPTDQKAQKPNRKARKIHEKARKIHEKAPKIEKAIKGIEKELKKGTKKELKKGTKKELEKGTIYYLTILYILMYNMLYKLLI